MHSLLKFTTFLTRTMQTFFPSRPAHGIWSAMKMVRTLHIHMTCVVKLPNGVHMSLNSQDGMQKTLMFYGTFQPAVANALKNHTAPHMYCLDIGANLGYFALSFAQQVGSDGKVAAFEANPPLAAYLRTEARRNAFANIQVLEDIMHEKSGEEIPFYISTNSGMSSAEHTHAGNVKEVLHKRTITVDDFIEAQRWKRLDVIKIDVEGVDCNVLLGAAKSLRAFTPFVIFEHHWNTNPETIARTRTLFETLPYSLSILCPDGTTLPFTWERPADFALEHVDVICERV